MLGFLTYVQTFLAKNVRRDDAGATAAEYALMVSLIAVVIVAAVAAFGIQVNLLFTPMVGAF